MSVRAMKAGAAEPHRLDHQVLLDAVHAAIERDRAGARDGGRRGAEGALHELRSAKAR